MNCIFCILGDCNKEECHNCYPVKNCSFNHDICRDQGMCDELDPTKRILVTGCAGFIGSHTCEYLLKHNYQVLSLIHI